MIEPSAFELSSTYVHLRGNDALPIQVTPTFWQELMNADPHSEGVRRVAEGGGWLMTSFQLDQDPPHWEMHPEGDEILFLVSGAMRIVLHTGGAENDLKLQSGAACVVPRGVWHRLVVGEPSVLLGVTYGEGTQVRPV